MRVLKTFVTLFVAGVVWTTGCAGVKSPAGEDPAALGGFHGVAGSGVDNDPVYLMLTAEVAGQRGRPDIALDSYIRLLEATRDPRVAERATQVAVYLKDSGKAAEAAEIWAELEPKSIPAHRLTLMLRVRTDDIDDAADEILRLIELKDPEFENTLLELARWINEEKERERGLEIMRELVERLPKVPEVHLAAAYLAAEEGALLVAREEVGIALGMRPTWSRALMLQAQLLLQSGDMSGGRAALEKARRNDPKNMRLSLVYGQFLAKTGDFAAAERELIKVVDREPGNEDARFALASVWLELGLLDKARKEFERLALDPRLQSQVNFSIALIDAREGRAEDALRGFDRVTDGPALFDARLNSISALILMGRSDEARRRLADARKEFPQEAARLYLIEAELLVKQRKTDAAFELLTEGVGRFPGQPELLYSRALIAEQMGRIDVMEADLKALLQQTPDDPSALNALGFSLAVHDPARLDEAEGYIRRALVKRPGDPAILDSFGWVLFRKGKLQEAVVPLKKAYGLFADPEIAAHLGEALWLLGRKAEARRIWQEGWRKDPQQRDIQKVHEIYPDAFQGVAK